MSVPPNGLGPEVVGDEKKTTFDKDMINNITNAPAPAAPRRPMRTDDTNNHPAQTESSARMMLKGMEPRKPPIRMKLAAAAAATKTSDFVRG